MVWKEGDKAVFLDLEAIPRRVILKNRGPETEKKKRHSIEMGQ